MADALLRLCSWPGGCPALVAHGRCDEHRRQTERQRGTRTERGYGAAWQRFRGRFKSLLLAHDIAPVCGAALPGGPSMAFSACKAAGRLVSHSRDGSDLHLHHDPPLQNDERMDSRTVCDPMRIGLVCEDCHRTETRRQQSTAEV